MSELHALADIGKDDGVITDNIAPTDGMDADLLRRAGSDIAEASVAAVLVILETAHVGEDLYQSTGGAAGAVFFQAVMHLQHFEIKIRAQQFRRLACEPEEGVHADAEV